MNRKLYIRCSCGVNKLLASKYRQLGYEVIINSPSRRKEIAQYNTKMPFIVDQNGVTKL